MFCQSKQMQDPAQMQLCHLQHTSSRQFALTNFVESFLTRLACVQCGTKTMTFCSTSYIGALIYDPAVVPGTGSISVRATGIRSTGATNTVPGRTCRRHVSRLRFAEPWRDLVTLRLRMSISCVRLRSNFLQSVLLTYTRINYRKMESG